MTKQTKNLISVGVLVLAGYGIYKLMNQPKGFANAIGKGKITGRRAGTDLPQGEKDCFPGGCCIYRGGGGTSSAGGGLASVNTILDWSNSSNGRGVIMANDNNRCTICPYSPSTPTGTPIGF